MFSADYVTYDRKKETERLEMLIAFRKYNIFNLCEP